MISWRPMVLLCALAAVLPLRLHAAEGEAEAWAVANDSFSLGGTYGYERADRQLASFILNFPTSTNLPDARLLQAQARLKLGNVRGALEVLEPAVGSAGDRTPDFLFWIGKAQFAKEDYPEAARAFERVAGEFPDSDKALEACVRGAEARVRLNDYAGAAERLGATNSPLQRALRQQPNPLAFVIGGQLLYADALLHLHRYGEMADALAQLAEARLSPEQIWQRFWIETCGLRDQDQLTNAVDRATNLVAAAKEGGGPARLADSYDLLGELLERLGRTDEAVSVYEMNLATNTPAASRRYSFLKIVDLLMAQDQLNEVTNRINRYAQSYPGEENLTALLGGELRLRQYAGAPTNGGVPVARAQLLGEARTLFERLSGDLTNSSVLGKAQLLLGWCYWEEGKIDESRKAFQLAATNLPPSLDQAVARFKLAEAQLRIGDATNAAAGFRRLLEGYGRQAAVTNRLLEPLLYELLRASHDLNDRAGAATALQRLLDEFPKGYYTKSALLVAGQMLAKRDPAGARDIFSTFASRFPDDLMWARAELAVANTYELEGNWPGAIQRYDELLNRIDASPYRPLAEYYRGFAMLSAGDRTNAFICFTNFVSHYPTHELTPAAILSIGDEYFRQGFYDEAERRYKSIFVTNSLASEWTLRALLMAGRAAFAGERWGEAKGHFTRLVDTLKTQTNQPPERTAEAYLMLGDSYLALYLNDSTKPQESLEYAIGIFRIAAGYSNSPLAAVAMARLGDAYAQDATGGGASLTNALDWWEKARDLKAADVRTRNLAEITIGLATEKLARLQGSTNEAANLRKKAWGHYLNVVQGKYLRSGEVADPGCVVKAGLAAAQLSAEKQDYEPAVNLLVNLSLEFPTLSRSLEPSLTKYRRAQLNAQSP